MARGGKGWRLEFQLEGLQQVLGALDGLGRTLRNQILRKAGTEATTPFMRAARAGAPQDSGLLKKSIARRIKTYRQSGVVAVIVGPRTRFGGLVEVPEDKVYRVLGGPGGGGKPTIKISKPTPEQRLVKRRPTRYAHFLEFGTVHREKSEFLTPAWEATKGEARRILEERIWRELEQAAARGQL